MASKMILAACALVALMAMVECQPAAGGGWGAGTNPWIPPWVASAPWMPKWSPCTTVGSTCSDCTTRLVCTKVGGLMRACTDPLLPHCNLGECSATPSAECAPPAEAPASTAQAA
ncbi:hypothetical protein EVAR_16662_1 [Eumeta japonica]|uniref:Uncharacterized protein n=1 Tax=Eumeta variegata TaxID=151549 RepID=A0A4C1V0V3_EUMVA|nr:hypothetical protein EVAR_16662_1 [Eumeta japonica]